MNGHRAAAFIYHAGAWIALTTGLLLSAVGYPAGLFILATIPGLVFLHGRETRHARRTDPDVQANILRRAQEAQIRAEHRRILAQYAHSEWSNLRHATEDDDR